LTFTWGDVATAFHSTGIPDIMVYMRASKQIRQVVQLPAIVRRMLALAPLQALLRLTIDAMPEGPSDVERAAGRSVLVGEARNAAGTRVAARLVTPEGYTLTSLTALEIVRRVLAGGAVAGYQTPSRAFGANLIASIPGCSLDDTH
jgi:short subunit dehydrogenase-like uncharacterized protein